MRTMAMALALALAHCEEYTCRLHHAARNAGQQSCEWLRSAGPRLGLIWAAGPLEATQTSPRCALNDMRMPIASLSVVAAVQLFGT